MPRKELMTNAQFIERGSKLWKGKFDYSKTEFTGWKDKVTLICPVHGKFRQMADAHLAGKDCLKCARKIQSRGAWFMAKKPNA